MNLRVEEIFLLYSLFMCYFIILFVHHIHLCSLIVK